VDSAVRSSDPFTAFTQFVDGIPEREIALAETPISNPTFLTERREFGSFSNQVTLSQQFFNCALLFNPTSEADIIILKFRFADI
jgi:hypothetical protein